MDRDPFDFAPNELDADNEVERPKDGEDDPALMAPVLEALKTVRDPEIPVNLVELGLSGTTRASLGVYNDEDDIDRLVAAIASAREMFLR